MTHNPPRGYGALGPFAADLRHWSVNTAAFELGRGRGGSHCMTCPLERDAAF